MTALVIHRAFGWLPDGRRVTCEDWDGPEEAGEALRLAKLYMPQSFGEAALDFLADGIVHHMGLDPASPYGRSIIVEE